MDAYRQAIIDNFFDMHVCLRIEWIDVAIRFLHAKNITFDNKDALCKMIYQQWLFTDINESTQPSIIQIDASSKISKLQHPVVLQVKTVLDISTSFYSQIASFRPGFVDNSGFEALTENERENIQEAKPQRTLSLILTNGNYDLKAIEYYPIKELSIATKPGAKVLLIPPIKCRKGQLFLTSKNFQLLGGDVAQYVEMYNPIKMMSDKLGIVSKMKTCTVNSPRSQMQHTTAQSRSSIQNTMSSNAQQTPRIPAPSNNNSTQRIPTPPRKISSPRRPLTDIQPRRNSSGFDIMFRSENRQHNKSLVTNTMLNDDDIDNEAFIDEESNDAFNHVMIEECDSDDEKSKRMQNRRFQLNSVVNTNMSARSSSIEISDDGLIFKNQSPDRSPFFSSISRPINRSFSPDAIVVSSKRRLTDETKPLQETKRRQTSNWNHDNTEDGLSKRLAEAELELQKLRKEAEDRRKESEIARMKSEEVKERYNFPPVSNGKQEETPNYFSGISDELDDDFVPKTGSTLKAVLDGMVDERPCKTQQTSSVACSKNDSVTTRNPFSTNQFTKESYAQSSSRVPVHSVTAIVRPSQDLSKIEDKDISTSKISERAKSTGLHKFFDPAQKSWQKAMISENEIKQEVIDISDDEDIKPDVSKLRQFIAPVQPVQQPVTSIIQNMNTPSTSFCNTSTLSVTSLEDDNPFIKRYKALQVIKLSDVMKKARFIMGTKRFMVQAVVQSVSQPLRIVENMWTMQVQLKDFSPQSLLTCFIDNDTITRIIGWTAEEAMKIRQSSDTMLKAEGANRLKIASKQIHRLDLLMEIEVFSGGVSTPIIRKITSISQLLEEQNT